MDQNSLRKLVEGQLLRLEGNTFQDCMDRLGLELYPGDYQPVRAGGPKGDTKNDGYCPKARVFFAAHATRGERIDKTKAKIRGDLEGCLKEHRDVRVWRFLTNDTMPGEVDQFIDNELRPLYPSVAIEVWGLKTLAAEVSKLRGHLIWLVSRLRAVVGIVERLVPDELWELFQRVVPEAPSRPQGGGRRRHGDREVLAAIVFVATSGCTWQQLPSASFGPSGATAHRRFAEWTKARVWAKLYRLVLDELGARGELDWSRCAIDSVNMRALKRGT